RLAERVLADSLDADLLDQVVAGRSRVQRRDVGRAREEACRSLGVLQLRLEPERARVRLPAHEGRLQHAGQIWAHVQPAVARAATQPLDAATDGEVDVQRADVERHDAGGL